MPETSPVPRHTFARHVAPFAPLALAMLMNSGSHPGTRTSAPGAVEQLATGEPGFAQSCTSPLFPTETPAALEGTDCNVSGNGGAETWQNEAKNNFCPSESPRPITIAEMVQLQGKVQQEQNIPFGNPRQHPLTSKPGPARDRTALVALGEGNEVVLEGYVRIARQEGAESVNCGSHVPNTPDDHDIHISIVQNQNDTECSGWSSK